MKRRPKRLVPTENLAADADAILQVKFWLTGVIVESVPKRTLSRKR